MVITQIRKFINLFKLKQGLGMVHYISTQARAR